MLGDFYVPILIDACEIGSDCKCALAHVIYVLLQSSLAFYNLHGHFGRLTLIHASSRAISFLLCRWFRYQFKHDCWSPQSTDHCLPCLTLHSLQVFHTLLNLLRSSGGVLNPINIHWTCLGYHPASVFSYITLQIKGNSLILLHHCLIWSPSLLFYSFPPLKVINWHSWEYSFWVWAE